MKSHFTLLTITPVLASFCKAVRNSIGLLFVFYFFSCSDNQSIQSEKYFGSRIANGVRRGRFFKDSTGTTYFYCYITTTITNDSIIPMNLKVALSKEFYQPTPINRQRFKVFFQDRSVLCNRDLKIILNEPPATLNKVINPKEECDLYIGFLADSVSELSPLPFTLFSKGQKRWLGYIPDRAVNQVITTKNELTLLLGLGFSQTGHDSCYSIIPCGQISFTNE
ncbi:MAG: hypothetical protein V4608_03985 [Bacteroidota bacterium]